MSATPLFTLLPWAGFVGPGIVITKNGTFQRTFQVIPYDHAFSSETDIYSINEKLHNAIRNLGDGWACFIDSVRREIPVDYECTTEYMPEVVQKFETDLPNNIGTAFSNYHYITFTFTPTSKKTVSSLLFSSDKPGAIGYDLREFRNTTEDIQGILSTIFISAKPLSDAETLSFLLSTFSDYQKVLVPENKFYLDVFLANQKFLYKEDVLKIDDQYVTVLSLTQDWPDYTRPMLFSAVCDSTGFEIRFSSRFVFLSRQAAKKHIQTIRKAHFQKRQGAGAAFQEAVMKEAPELEDTEALANTAETSEVLSSLSTGLSYGFVTSVFVIRDASPKLLLEKTKYLKTRIAELGFIPKQESIATLQAFLGSMPGNLTNNVRKFPISTRNFVGFFPISGFWEGSFSNHHIAHITGLKFPLMVTRSGRSPFYFNLHVQDVGHTLIIGPTGSGKSILLNVLAYRALRYPGSKIIFFDKDKSSYWPCINSGGGFYDIGNDEHPETNLKFNPFWHIEKEDETEKAWLANYLANYFREKGLSISPADENGILDTLRSLAASNKSKNWETFSQQIQNREIREACTPFTKGEYKDLFTPDADDWTSSIWTTFEMNTLMNRDDKIVRFILGYLFHRIDLSLELNGPPTWLILDEAWLMLGHEYFRSFLLNWLKTLRKKNTAVILATQELQDAEKSPIFSTIVNACQTRIFLPNPAAWQSDNLRLLRDLQLTDEDIKQIATAQPKADYFYTSPEGKQLFTLGLTRGQLDLLKYEYRKHTDPQETGLATAIKEF